MTTKVLNLRNNRGYDEEDNYYYDCYSYELPNITNKHDFLLEENNIKSIINKSYLIIEQPDRHHSFSIGIDALVKKHIDDTPVHFGGMTDDEDQLIISKYFRKGISNVNYYMNRMYNMLMKGIKDYYGDCNNIIFEKFDISFGVSIEDDTENKV